MSRPYRGNSNRGNSSNYGGDRGGFRGGARGGTRGGLGRRAPSFEDIPVNMPLDLSSLKIALKTNPMFSPRKPVASRKGVKQINVLTNAYELTVKPSKIYLYDVAFFLNMEDGSRTELILNKDDCSCQNLFELKFHVLKKAMEVNKMCDPGKHFAYDGNKLLFTYKEISPLLPKEGFFSITPNDLADRFKNLLKIRNLKSMDMIIQKAEGHSEISSTGYETSQMAGNLNSSDCSYSQAFDVITSMKAAETENFLFMGKGLIYPKNQTNEVSSNLQVTYDGLSKSTRIVEGKTRNKIVPVILMDYRMGQFHAKADLLEYISNIARNSCRVNNISMTIPVNVQSKVKQILNGVRLETKSGRDPITFKGFSKEPVSQIEVTKTTDNGKIKVPLPSVYENLRCQKGFPAVMSAREKSGRFTPFMNVIEDLKVAPHQRVRQSRAAKAGGQVQAERPQVRHDKTESMVKQIGLDGFKNDIMDSFQLSIEKNPMTVQAFYRRYPQVTYANGVTKTPNSDGSWAARDKFFRPAEGFQMIAMYDAHDFEGVAVNLIKSIQSELQGKGCVSFTQIRVKHVNRNILEKEFALIAGEGKKTIIFYVGDDDDVHGELKYYERKFLIPTQHVLPKSARDYNGQPFVKPMTLSNICLKTNLKTGGFNHSVKPDEHCSKVWISDKKTLVISYVLHRGSTSYDEAMQVPSVVGYSFNGSNIIENFIGDFHLQDPKNQYVDLDVLRKLVQQSLKMFLISNKTLPERIVLLREGTADSQFSYIVENELVEIRKSCVDFAKEVKAANFKPLFQLSLVTKKHNMRFFRFRERSSSEPSRGMERDVHNVDVATVMDCQIVRPNITEFFMQAHKVIKGSGRIPLYTTLIDELNWSMDTLQSFMLSLCFTHQINEKPISLPEPLYQANEWAKRGYEMVLFHKANIGPLGVDYKELTSKLAYAGTRLQTLRVNA